MNELDYFVKYKLRAKFYIRYLDDFVILHNDRNTLEIWKIQIDKFLRTALKLELHPEKSKIYPLHKGTNFLGLRIFYCHKLLKKSNIKSINSRLREFIKVYKQGYITREEIENRMDGWFAYAIHGNTHKLCNRLKKTIRKVIS